MEEKTVRRYVHGATAATTTARSAVPERSRRARGPAITANEHDAIAIAPQTRRPSPTGPPSTASTSPAPRATAPAPRSDPADAKDRMDPRASAGDDGEAA